MRILLATEGQSDEIVASSLLCHFCPGCQIDPKKFTARGIAVISRFAPIFVQAAHYGHYDLLVIQFDIDDTLEKGCFDVKESQRWKDIDKKIRDKIATLPNLTTRENKLQISLMAPIQSTDAWLTWAVNNGGGKQWEAKDRAVLKEKLYGNPPVEIIERSKIYTPELLKRLNDSTWPISLVSFSEQLKTAQANLLPRKATDEVAPS